MAPKFLAVVRYMSLPSRVQRHIGGLSSSTEDGNRRAEVGIKAKEKSRSQASLQGLCSLHISLRQGQHLPHL